MGRAVTTGEAPRDAPERSSRSLLRRALLEAIGTTGAIYRRHEARIAGGGDYEASARRAIEEAARR